MRRAVDVGSRVYAGGLSLRLTLEEYRVSSARLDHTRGWARAKDALDRAAHAVGDAGCKPDIGFVKKVGEGLSRDIFAARVELRIDGELRAPAWAVLLPRRDAPKHLDERVRREAALLKRLPAHGIPFCIPAAVAVVDDPCGLALVRDFVLGYEVDLRAGRMAGIRPWDVVGEIAAVIHGLDPEPLSDLVPGHDTRRAAAEARLEELAGLDSATDALVSDALGWARDHLPPPVPSALVHGDLLGQNILLGPDRPPTVIDWEFAVRGDPAWDLAIVTRGVRRPFQVEGGLRKLLDAYNARSARPLFESDVRFNEICLHLSWWSEAADGGSGPPPDQVEPRLRNLLRAVERLP
jgi:aminoglycoside phosphotransferase (APT) family kinase protein